MSDPHDPKPIVVLVDDDVALRAALTFNLEIEGFEVQTCQSGEALLAHALPDHSACLVLDYNLPGITGLAALVELRRRRVELPALMITSHPPPNVREGIKAAGAVLVEKPLLSDALVGAIRDALQASSQPRDSVPSP